LTLPNCALASAVVTLVPVAAAPVSLGSGGSGYDLPIIHLPVDFLWETHYGQAMIKEERFWAKVIVRGASECWEWFANKNNKGYGMFCVSTAVGKKLAHRVSYEMKFGRIPKGLIVRHKCDNPACVNPAHLELGTMKDNARDCSERERTGKTKLTNEDAAEIRRRYIAGESRTSIAKAFGVGDPLAQDIIYGRSWTHLLHLPGISLAELKAARNFTSNAKVTQEIAETIRTRIAAGEQGKDLAIEYGIHKATVSDIKLRKIWA